MLRRFLVIMLCFIFFVGCDAGEDAMDDALQLRQNLFGCSHCSFDCTITADYSDRIYSFSLQCSFDGQGNMEFSVIEPNSISGITGKMDAKGGKLTFDDQVLMFPMLADGYISPVSAPWLLMQTLRGGYIHSAVQTENGGYFVYHDTFCEESLQVDVWTDDSGNPNAAEILWKGRRILTVTVTNFSCV